MKQRNSFTLIELLVVIAIIGLLAGLILPAVISAQQQGRITAAKSDMSAILLALKNVENTYNKMVAVSGSNASWGGKNVAIASGDNYCQFGGTDAGTTDVYNAFIAELSNPLNGKTGFSPSLNKRKIKFLDPKAKYDPTKDYDHADNLPNLWLDPWGMQYVILMNTDFSDVIPNPADTAKKLSAKAVVYSLGPNQTDNHAKNFKVDIGNPVKTDDDIASWNN